MEALGTEFGDFIEKFEACEDLERQLVMFHSKQEITDFVKEHLNVDTDVKNDNLANRLKDEGNKLFMKSKDSSALEKYNEALFHASRNGTALSLILANRSAVFYKQGKFEQCEKDIKMALAWNYPNKMKYKLLDRRAKCLYKLGRFNDMMEDIETVKKLLENEDLSKDKVDKILADLNNLVRTKSKQKAVKLQPSKKTVCSSVNNNFSGFSASMRMNYSPGRGRFMVADRDVGVGEVLGAEDPVASSLLPSWSNSLCTVCFKSAEEAPLPCLTCCKARFCSEECWREGEEGSHRWVCGVRGELGDILKQVKGSESCPEYYRLCVMVMGRHSVEEMVEIMEMVENRKELDMAEVPVQKESDLRSLFNLVSNDEERNLQTDFWIFLTVIYFLHVLEKKKMFTDLNMSKSDDLSRQKITIGLLMIRTLRVSKLFN